jgi:hypothetical protein
VDDGYVDKHDVRRRRVRFEHRFVDGAPPTLEPGVVYISIRHKSVLHLCACGCGHEVVTPLAPHRWQLTFDGETVSLEPSVGNSVLPCRSHYFITNNEVDWHRPMTDIGIERARRRDQRAVDAAFGPPSEGQLDAKHIDPEIAGTGTALPGSAGSEADEAAPAYAAVTMAPRGDGWTRLRRRLWR